MALTDKVSIRWSITVSFLLIIFSLIVFGLFSLSEMRTLGDLTETLYQHPLRVSNAALSAQGGIVRMHRDMKDVVLSDSQQELQRFLQQVREEEQQVYAQLDIVSRYILGEEGQLLVAEATEAFSGWKAIRDRVIFLVRDGRREAATDITRGEGAEYVRELERRMEALTRYARNKADGFMANATEVQDTVVSQTLIILLFIVALLCTIWLTMRRIIGRLADFQATLAEQDASGELFEVTVNGSSEIASLGRAFNVLIRDLQRQFQVREGLNRLSSALVSVRTLDDFNGALSLLSRHVGASSAALFVFDSKTERLNLLADFALPEGFSPKSDIPPGQGVVGQVARDRQPVLLADAVGSGMKNESGTGERMPGQVYALPLELKNELVGVIEFAFMLGIRDTDRAFLKLAGDFLAGAMLTITSRMEVDRLLAETNSANAMLEEKSRELEEMNQALTDNNAELDARSTELKARTDELSTLAEQLTSQKKQLEIKQRQAEEADRLKSEFLSNMSHELRTPLNSILALSRLMLRGRDMAAPDKETEYLDVIERNGRHLLTLINNILDLSRIESGNMGATMIEFDPATVVAEVVETMRPLARDKGLELNADVSVSVPVVSDRDKVLQILLNLVSNAVKFTESGGVDLRLKAEGNDVHFLIIDTGIGIPEDQADAIFDQFRQVDGSLSRRHEGSGLGLAISREFARLLGGDLTVKSMPEQGSCFTLILPRGDAGQRASVSPAAPAESPPRRKGEGTVLVVDDLPRHRRMLRDVLTEAGYSVIESDNGQEAIQAAISRQPDAITLDVFMPGMDGWEVLRKLKELPETADIPVLIVSISPDQVTAMALGAEGCLAKPLDRNRLLLEMERLRGRDAIRLVLVVDDEMAVQEDMRSLLTDEGYEVAVAGDGDRGLALTRRLRPDIILLDLYMPVMNGFTMLRELRGSPDTADIPVIIVTARDLTPEDRAELMREASRVLSKGQPVSEMLRTVREELDKLNLGGSAPSSADQPLFEPATILAVEDNESNVMVLREVLGETPWDLVVALDGEEGVEAARTARPDLILMDVHLPGMSGTEATRLLREEPEMRDVVIIALTARSMAGDREQFLEAGCDDYLAKPYDPDELVERVDAWLRKGRNGT